MVNIPYKGYQRLGNFELKTIFGGKFCLCLNSLKIIKFIYSVDKTLGVIKIMDLNWTGPRCYSSIFLTTVPSNKMELFPYIVLRVMCLTYNIVPDDPDCIISSPACIQAR